MIFRSASRTWTPLTTESSNGHSQSNIPVGILSGQEFLSAKLKLSHGDQVVAYTRALFEAHDSDGEMLRASGIAEIANSISMDASGDFVTTLLQKLRDLNPKNLASDDTTVVLARVNTQNVSLTDNVFAPLRLLRRLFG